MNGTAPDFGIQLIEPQAQAIIEAREADLYFYLGDPTWQGLELIQINFSIVQAHCNHSKTTVYINYN